MNTLAGSRILVTGATGMVGQRLVEILLQQQARVRVLTRNAPAAAMLWPGLAVDICQGDLLQPGLAAVCADIDGIFHLASFQPGSQALDPEAGAEHYRVTVQGTKALLEAAAVGTAVVLVSSIRAGDGSSSDYAQAKREAEKQLLAAGKSGRCVSVLRLPPVYGAMNGGAVAAIIRGVDRGQFKVLPDFAERRSMVHRDDVAQALLLMLDNPLAEGKVYTVTDAEIYSFRCIYDLACSVLGRSNSAVTLPAWFWRMAAGAGSRLQSMLHRPMPLTRERLARLQADAWFDGTAICSELGFTPRYNLARAMPELVQAYLAELHDAQQQDLDDE